MNKSVHEKYMRLCFELALKGVGNVSPNPMVGAVVVKNGKIVGKGYHEIFGGPHAEVNALRNAKKNTVGADLYVNLEPCSHFGKTPPCVDLIIKKKIKRVIIATRDPNPLVNGKGIKKLRNANIKVIESVLPNEAMELNAAFFKYIQKKIPYVAIKIAQTIDAKIADEKFKSKWITNLDSRIVTHKLRSSYDAIMVGANTVKIDNPKLTVRLVKGKNPVRVVLDGKFELNTNYNIFKNTKRNPTILFVSKSAYDSNPEKLKKMLSNNVKVIPLKSKDNTINLKQVLKKLYSLNISSVLVEGGSSLFTQFLKTQLADYAYIFIANKILGGGIMSISNEINRPIHKPIRLTNTIIENIQGSVLIKGKINY